MVTQHICCHWRLREYRLAIHGYEHASMDDGRFCHLQCYLVSGAIEPISSKACALNSDLHLNQREHIAPFLYAAQDSCTQS